MRTSLPLPLQLPAAVFTVGPAPGGSAGCQMSIDLVGTCRSGLFNYVLRNIRPKLPSTNQRIPCAYHDFAPPHSSTHTHTHAISRTGPRNPTVSPAVHNSLRLPRKTMPGHATGHTIPHADHVKRTPRARIPTPVTRKHARDTSDSNHSPDLPRETHAQQRQNARFTTPAKRIHRPTPSQTLTCIRSPTPTTRNANPRSSAAHALPRSPTPATRNAHTHARSKLALPNPQTINENPSLRFREKR